MPVHRFAQLARQTLRLPAFSARGSRACPARPRTSKRGNAILRNLAEKCAHSKRARDTHTHTEGLCERISRAAISSCLPRFFGPFSYGFLPFFAAAAAATTDTVHGTPIGTGGLTAARDEPGAANTLPVELATLPEATAKKNAHTGKIRPIRYCWSLAAQFKSVRRQQRYTRASPWRVYVCICV